MSDDDSGNGGIIQKLAQVLTLSRYSGGHGFSNAATWVAMISAITGGVIGLSTYRMDVNKQVDESVEKAFEMILAYNASDLTTPRKHALSYVYARRACDARLIERDLTDADIVHVLEFYDLVYTCTQTGLCDGPTIHRYFEPHASFQWPVLQKVVSNMRAQPNTIFSAMPENSFGAGMKAFASPDATAPPCEGNF